MLYAIAMGQITSVFHFYAIFSRDIYELGQFAGWVDGSGKDFVNYDESGRVASEVTEI